MVGRPRSTAHSVPFSHSLYIGERAWSSRHVLTPSFPVEEGRIRDGNEDFEVLLRHAYSQCDPFMDEPLPLLMTEPHRISSSNREQFCQLAFEALNVPSFGLLNAQLLALHSQGLSSGLVIDFGLHSTRIVPVNCGVVEKDAAHELEVGGDMITRHLIKCLSDCGWSLTGSQSLFEQIDEMKKEVCYVPGSLENEQAICKATPKAVEKSWQAPTGGSAFAVASPRFMAAEALFNPSLVNLDALGLFQLVTNSIHRSSQPTLLASNIVLAGGTALLPGLAARLESTLKYELNSKEVNVQLAESKQAAAPWVGASLVAQNDPLLKAVSITKAYYDEHGPNSIQSFSAPTL